MDHMFLKADLEKITSFLRSQGNPDYIEEITKFQESNTSDEFVRVKSKTNYMMLLLR